MESPSAQVSASFPTTQAPSPSLSPPEATTPQSEAPIYPPPQSQAPSHTSALSLPLPLPGAPSQISVPNCYSSAPPQDQFHGLHSYGGSQASPAPTPTRFVESSMHKNHLQHYCQKSGIPLPVYHTVKEEIPHPPRFRSTVLVDGRRITSPNTFMQRKAAEQDVARIALEQLPKRIEDKIGSKDLRELICQDATFCKMIVNEFAIKMNMEKGTYKTVQSEGLLPVFCSSLVLNNISYNGEAGKNKKEAEQLAARAAILSLLGDPTYAASMCEVVKSKIKLYATFQKVNTLVSNANQQASAAEVEMPTVDDNMVALVNQQAATTEPSPSELLIGDNKPATVNSQDEMEEHGSRGVLVDNTPKPSSEAQPSPHEFKSPNSESSVSQQISLPIAFVPATSEQGSAPDSSSSKKRRKNKKKANKRSRAENNGGSGISPRPSTQTPACSVTQ